MSVRSKIISFLLILLVLVSPPSVFVEALYFGREIRYFLVTTIFILLLLYLNFYKLKFTDLSIIFLLVFCIFLELILLRSRLSNIFSFYSIFLLVFFLNRFLKSNKINCDIFLSFWLSFSFILSVAAIFSFSIHQFSNFDFDILNFRLSGLFNETYNYRMSIFGFTMEKNFGFVQLARVCSFFNEPQYAGLFFFFNLCLTKIYSNKISKKYFFANFISGLLTFSLSFYIICSMFLFFYSKSYQKIIIVMSLIILLFLIYYYSNNYNLKELLSFSSFDDRLMRNLNAINILYEESNLNLLIGKGFDNYVQLSIDGKETSSGLLYLINENGFFGLLIILIILINFSKKNYILLLVCIIYFIIMPWFKYLFPWYILILCRLNYTNTFRNKKIDNKIF